VCVNTQGEGESALTVSIKGHLYWAALYLLNRFLANPLQIPQWWIMDRKLWRDIRQTIKIKIRW